MTSLGLLLVLGWMGGITLTAAGLRAPRPSLVWVGAGLFVLSTVTWVLFVNAQD